MTTPDSIEPEVYKRSLQQTTSTWPACSPDMPQHPWDVTDRRAQHPHPPANQHELIQDLQREWLRNPTVPLRRLTYSNYASERFCMY